MAATDTWSCTAEVLPGRQAESSVDVDHTATPAHHKARQRSPRELSEDGVEQQRPPPPRSLWTAGIPPHRETRINTTQPLASLVARKPGSHGPGAPSGEEGLRGTAKTMAAGGRPNDWRSLSSEGRIFLGARLGPMGARLAVQQILDLPRTKPFSRGWPAPTI